MLRTNRKQTIALLVLLAGTTLAGCRQPAPPAQTQRPPAEVDMITLTTRPVTLTVELPGRTAAYRVAEVRPQVSGIVEKRLFTEGAEVEAGEVLYQIDPALYRAKVASAEAALARAKAVEHSARLKAERYRTLVKTKAVSELDQIETEAAWQQAVADVAAAKAALNSARIDLDYTRVTAPISGRIGRSVVSEGALVTAQQATALAVIQQLDPLYVDVTQSSTELLRLRKELSAGLMENSRATQSEVTILLEDGSRYERPGSLEFSDVSVEETTGAVTLRAIVANPDQELLPGMFVRARLAKGTRQDAILIPAASISRNSKGQAVVMLVDASSTVESRVIDSGQNLGDQVLVNGGLAAGERLIVSGLQKIRPGAPVKGVEQQPALAGRISLKPDQSGPAAQAE